jgi:rhodanese-related sulfurtransferase
VAEQGDLPIELSVRDVVALRDDDAPFYFLDCRESDEYATARIEGATLMPMSAFVARVAELEPHRAGRIVVHCHHGGRSLRVARWLREQGFSQAQSMAGGIDAWSTDIDPNVPRY